MSENVTKEMQKHTVLSNLKMGEINLKVLVEDEESQISQSQRHHHLGHKILPFSPTQSHIIPIFEQEKIEEYEKECRITLSDRLGLEDFLSPTVWRASAAEFLGTASLVFMIQAIIISANETDIAAPKLIMAFLICLTNAILALATMPVSGGHINPTVTLSASLVGVISLSRGIIYIFAQCMGAVLGAAALKSVISDDLERLYSLAGCTVTTITTTATTDGSIITGLNTVHALRVEIICTFVFLFASRWIALDQRQAKTYGRVIVCLAIGMGAGLSFFVSTTVTTIKGYSGAGVNPARCFGPAIVRGGHLWNGHWVFWAGPALASFTFYLYTKIIPGQQFRPEENRHDFFNVIKGVFDHTY